jgi:hypothetical protein
MSRSKSPAPESRARRIRREYKNISFIREIADAAVDDITAGFWRGEPFPKSRPPGRSAEPTASIMPAISASTRPCEGMRRLPAKRPRNTGLLVVRPHALSAIGHLVPAVVVVGVASA